MDNNPHIKLVLHDRSYSSSVKKEVRRIGEQAGLSEKRLAEADIVISEMVSNLNKHTSGGELLVKELGSHNGRSGLEILSIDSGPGIENLAEMLKDGRSTVSTLGHGLGAMQRLSDDFQIYSLPKWGTIVLSRIYIKKDQQFNRKFNIAVNSLLLPKNGETVSGDGWMMNQKSFEFNVIALDGLGHGPEAHKASKAAVDEFNKMNQSTPAETIRILHRNIRGTRGAVGMVMHLNGLTGILSYAGLGNISARIFGQEKTKSCISYNGIIGHTIPATLHTNHTEFRKGDILILNSDGLKTRWDLNHLPNILNHDGSIIAAALYKDFSRNTDDLLVVVIKQW